MSVATAGHTLDTATTVVVCTVPRTRVVNVYGRWRIEIMDRRRIVVEFEPSFYVLGFFLGCCVLLGLVLH